MSSKFGLDLSGLLTKLDKVSTAVTLLPEMAAKLERIEKELSERKPVKEFYSVKEAADIMHRVVFTVREWCRLGRIRAKKAACGRSVEGEWLVSHEELTRVQNEGLEPEGTFTNR